MSRVFRSAMAGLFVATVVLVARPTAGPLGDARAQQAAQRPTSASPATAGQVAPFVGDWLVSMSMQAFEATFLVTVKNDAGKPSATVAADGQPTATVTDVLASGNSLILKYFI